MTIILKISKDNPEKILVKQAAVIIKEGGLVAFPTETVYGLGADALNPKAVAKIFEAKGRPADNPLIAHIADKKDVYRLAKEVPKEAELLMKEFWPGPLTIILKKSNLVPDIVTAGLDTVAIRMPSHKVALALIKEAKTPIAAPSANLSGKPSPTDAGHVIEDMKGRVDVIIDSGKTDIGVESTVIDMTVKPPLVLRPGGLPKEELEEFLKNIGKEEKSDKPKAPGMKYRHYAPNADVIVVEGNKEKVMKKTKELIEEYKLKGKKVGVMAAIKEHGYEADVVKFIGSTEKEVAKKLFRALRDFDKEDIHVIIAEGIEEKGIGEAVMNRLRKAAGYNVVEVR
ncbi:MAG: L-threonylcarbamoyladenylate synthase [Nanoarchaeota archaeon]|nr:L-threonylcarbamoyladenylate synthase [Nanoarchaeota archaeon]